MLNKNKFLILFGSICVLIVIVLITYNVYGINYSNNSYEFQIVYKILASEIFIYFITIIFLGSIIGWHFIFSVIKQPSSLKQKLANQYVLFLVSIVNHERIPNRFISFTVVLGTFLGRKLIWFMSIPYPNSLLVIFFPFYHFFELYFFLRVFFIEFKIS